jgi:hypothetical protein
MTLNYANPYMFFLIQLNTVWILSQMVGFFQVMDWNNNSVGRKKIRMRILGEVSIYLYIDNHMD